MFDFLPDFGWISIAYWKQRGKKPSSAKDSTHILIYLSICFFSEKSLTSGAGKDIFVGSEKVNDTFSEKRARLREGVMSQDWRVRTGRQVGGGKQLNACCTVSLSDSAFYFLLCVRWDFSWVHEGKTGHSDRTLHRRIPTQWLGFWAGFCWFLWFSPSSWLGGKANPWSRFTVYSAQGLSSQGMELWWGKSLGNGTGKLVCKSRLCE